MTTDALVIHVRLPKALVKRLDHWSIDAEFKTRQDAIAFLLTLGLARASGVPGEINESP